MNLQELPQGLPTDLSEEERFLLRKALCKLSLHDDTPRRLKERLLRYRFREEAVEETSADRVVEFLVERGLLKESAYADDLVRALVSRGYGTRRIVAELSGRRFSGEEIERVKRELSERKEEEEGERAFEMLSRRACARKSNAADKQEIQKLYAYLVRLGFGYETAKEAIDRWKEEEEQL